MVSYTCIQQVLNSKPHTILCHQLWFYRNKLLKTQEFPLTTASISFISPPLSMLVHKINGFLFIFLCFTNKLGSSLTNTTSSFHPNLIPRPSAWFKFNFDVVVKPNNVYFVVICRNHLEKSTHAGIMDGCWRSCRSSMGWSWSRTSRCYLYTGFGIKLYYLWK